MRFQAVIVVAVLLLCAGAVYSQVPPYINYQGVLTGPGGEPVPDGMYGMGFVLFDAAEFGTPLYEWISGVQVTKGIFNVNLGPIDLPFDRQYWLGITIEEEPMLFPRVPLVASPYCFMAKSVVDNAITTNKIADGQVVRTLNSLTDQVNLVPGANVSITPSGNDLVISATGGGGGVSGSGAAGQVSFWNGTSSISGDNGLYWDNTNKRLGVGTTGPNARLRVESNEQFTGVFASTYQSETTEVLRANYLGGGEVDAVAIKGISLPSEGHGIGGSFTGGKSGIVVIGNGGNHSGYCYGIEATATGATSMGGLTSRVAVFGTAEGPNTLDHNIGVVGVSSGEAITDTGVKGYAMGDDQILYGVHGEVDGSGEQTKIAIYGSTFYCSGLSYAGYFDGDVAYSGSLIGPPSDEKLKEDIEPLQGAVATIMQLEPVSFRYIDDQRFEHMDLSQGKHYGLIAQQLEEVVPELVLPVAAPPKYSRLKETRDSGSALIIPEILEEGTTYKGIKYVELIPILVQAIKEQQQTIEELRGEIEALKK
jgi:hypothetical protein